MKKTLRTKTVLAAGLLLSMLAQTAFASHDLNLAQKLIDELAKLYVKLWIIGSVGDLYLFLTAILNEDVLRAVILMNPPTEILQISQGFFIRMFQPFFVFAIVFTAGYLLFYSGSGKGRSKAKSLLIRLLIAMVLVSLSPFISATILAISQSLAALVLNAADIEVTLAAIRASMEHMFWGFATLTGIHRTGGVELLLLWESFLLILNFTMTFRFGIVMLWHTILPLTIAFYYFPLTKKMGKKLFHQLFLWTFVQVGWALGILTMGAAVPSLLEIIPDYPMSMIGFVGIMLLIGTPAFITGVKDWFSVGVEIVEIVNAAPFSMAALTIDETKVEREVVIEEEEI